MYAPFWIIILLQLVAFLHSLRLAADEIFREPTSAYFRQLSKVYSLFFG